MATMREYSRREGKCVLLRVVGGGPRGDPIHQPLRRVAHEQDGGSSVDSVTNARTSFLLVDPESIVDDSHATQALFASDSAALGGREIVRYSNRFRIEHCWGLPPWT